MPYSTKISFSGSLGNKLSAKVDLPDSPPQFMVLHANCFTCSKDHIATRYLARAFVSAGCGFFRYDLHGMWKSDGLLADATVESVVEDHILAAQFLTERYQPPELLTGHSFGGLVTLMAAQRIESATHLATLGTPSDLQSLLYHFDEDFKTKVYGITFQFGSKFIEQIANIDIKKFQERLTKPHLVMHSKIDDIVDYRHAQILTQNSKCLVRQVNLGELPHLISTPQNAKLIVNQVLSNLCPLESEL